jgi:outer membrane protein OmpA-like peptidoglycan-associated protein
MSWMQLVSWRRRNSATWRSGGHAIGLFCAVVLVLAAPALAQELPEPAEGCKDSTLLSGMPGCVIEECEFKEFDSRQLWVKPWNGEDDSHVKDFEGRVEKLRYVCPPRLSMLQVARNAEAAFRKAGFTIVFSGKGNNEFPYVTAQKGPQWVGIETDPSNDLTCYTQTAVLVEEMKQDLEADAAAMAAEIEKTGSVAVYGINFDTAKATLTPDSEKVLQEVLSLMNQQADGGFEVQGHTDNVGARTANQALSEQRAASVVSWLVKNGIDKTRLTPKGYGDSQPVADNTSDEGRAKNRRVELKKVP